MITTTFSYDNCISTYTLVVDRTSSTTTQRWLSERGVKFRTGYEASVTVIRFHIRNIPTDVLGKLINKFGLSRTESAEVLRRSTPTANTSMSVAGAIAPRPKLMAPVVFRFKSNRYELLVDNRVALSTTAWLESKGCEFDRYVMDGITRIVFISIPEVVVEAIAAKHGCINRPQLEPETIENTSCDTRRYSSCDISATVIHNTSVIDETDRQHIAAFMDYLKLKAKTLAA